MLTASVSFPAVAPNREIPIVIAYSNKSVKMQTIYKMELISQLWSQTTINQTAAGSDMSYESLSIVNCKICETNKKL